MPALRIKNPYFQTPVEAKANQHKAAVQSWLQTQSGNKFITIQELRTGLPMIAADLTRPVFNQIMSALSIEIDNPEEPDA